MPPATADGETRTSRVVGSVDFVRPTLPTHDDVGGEDSLITITGVRCSMPFTIKCSSTAGGASITVQDLKDISNKVFTSVEEQLNTYNVDSEVNKVNRLPPHAPHRMSRPLQEVIICAKELVKLTRGAFDPSVAPLLNHYKKVASMGTISEDNNEGGTTEEETKTDMETILRQRMVVDHLKGLLSRGFANDPSDARVSETVKKLLTVSTWGAAWSVGTSAAAATRASGGDANGLQRWTSLCVQAHGAKEISKKIAGALTDPSGSSMDGDVYEIRKKDKNAELDLNGISKGWAVDELAKEIAALINNKAGTSFASSSHPSVYVEWGGDVKVWGSHPSGRPWIVAVPEPPTLKQIKERVALAKEAGQTGPVYKLSDFATGRDTTTNQEETGKDEEKKEQDPTSYLAVLELRHGDAVATSGDSEKIIEHDGKYFCFILNPLRGRLLELNDSTLAAAVVVAKSCMVADALATAAISMEDPTFARAMLDPFRTGYRFPLSDYLLYARQGPRIIRLAIPGVEPKEVEERRLARHEPATVIVVGSGLAGLSAAIEAAEARAKVILLEKEPKLGGNSAKATSGINGWGTDSQAEMGVADEERLFERDTFRSGKDGNCNHSLVRTLSTKSAPAIHWLKHKFHIPLTSLSQLGGHSRKRTHRAPPDAKGNPVPIGWKITSTLQTAVQTTYANQIEVRCNQSVTKLLSHVDDQGFKVVTGVQVNGTEDIIADSVVLCTGGFGCSQFKDDGLMARFRPDLLHVPTTNGDFAQGDGVVLAEQLGAELIDMDKVQLHPTGFIDPKNPSNPTKFLAPEAIRGSGGILVNSEGKRFVDELDLRSVVAAAIAKHGSPYTSKEHDGYVGPAFAWCILAQPAQELFGKPMLGFYKGKLGLFEDAVDVEAAAAIIGCDVAVLTETLESYEEAAMVGQDYDTGKDVFPSLISHESKNLIMARVTPSIHYTMGGININAAGEVQEVTETSTVGSHRHIRGLYAAGEVTGGVHGGNRLGGNSLLECCVFGRIAGQRAATAKMPDPVMFPKAKDDDGRSESNWVPIVVREVRDTDAKYGANTREVRFNLHGPVQHSGLEVGQFVAIRGEMDGETLMGYFSPITRPSDEGVMGILCRVDEKGGPIAKLLDFSRPGSVLNMCAMGGLRLKFEGNKITFRGKEIRRIGLLAGGTGIAPMIQIIRAYGQFVRANPPGSIPPGGLNLIYAAEGVGDLAYMRILEEVRSQIPEHFRFYVKLTRPPLGWTEGVGYIERRDVMKQLVYPPTPGDLCVMCGPPVFESAMLKSLAGMGFDKTQLFSYSQDDHVSAHL